jgi:hypothetical protein
MRSCPLRVTSVALCDRWLPIDFRYAPFATEVMRRRKMLRRATSRHANANSILLEHVIERLPERASQPDDAKSIPWRCVACALRCLSTAIGLY